MGQYGWGIVQKQELIEAVNVAIDHGVTFFDTADTYGLGTAEENLAEALGSKRSKVIIGSKFGVRIIQGRTFYDNSRPWIKIALENSLRRLKTDYIDLYQIHYRDNTTPISEVIDTLESLKIKGYIRYYGLSNIHIEDIPELKSVNGSFVSIQDEYSLACRQNEADLLLAAEILAVTPMTWGSLGQGILTGKYNEDSIFSSDDRRHRDIYFNFHGEKLIQNLRIVEAMKPVAQAHNVPIAAVAIRFIFDHLKDSVVLVGAKRASQILESIKSTDWKLSDKELNFLDNISRHREKALQL